VDYDQAIRLDPNDAHTFNNRGNAYAAKKNYARAIADYDQAVRLDPNSSATRTGVARSNSSAVTMQVAMAISLPEENQFRTSALRSHLGDVCSWRHETALTSHSANVCCRGMNRLVADDAEGRFIDPKRIRLGASSHNRESPYSRQPALAQTLQHRRGNSILQYFAAAFTYISNEDGEIVCRRLQRVPRLFRATELAQRSRQPAIGDRMAPILHGRPASRVIAACLDLVVN